VKAAVLGCGLIGKEIARDLARDGEFAATAIDVNEQALASLQGVPGVKALRADTRDGSRLRALLKDCDIVVSAVPGRIGFETLKTVIEAGKNVVDISFSPEDAQELDGLAGEQGVIAVVDCGVAPGLSHILVGRAASELDEVESVAIYVGGLPAKPVPPWNYRTVFSLRDVIEEYARPARIVRGGEIQTVDELSEVELVDFPQVGTLEAFVTDGLRSLLRTIEAHEMSEKTLRYRGHVEKMRALRDAGCFRRDAITVGEASIRPVDLTVEMLASEWKLREGEEDLTVMRVIVEGTKAGEKVTRAYDMLDRYDRERGVTSMARTTGYTATAVVRLIRDGLFTRRGVAPPEHLGMDEGCYSTLLGMLKQRGIELSATVS